MGPGDDHRGGTRPASGPRLQRLMLVARDLEIRAGSRLLLQHASFHLAAGDKIGLVGRNGAGKTTLTKILSGESLPASGSISRSGAVGYLPQDPRTGDLDVLAKNRILSARGLDSVVERLRRAEFQMADDSPEVRDKAMAAYARAEAELAAVGGYAAEAEAARIASNLGLPERVLHQPLGTLSGGQRRRVELSRILFAGADTLLLDEPTNHLDADSIIWLRSFLQAHPGELLVISHDAGLLDSCVNKVFHLDANRAQLDIYAMDWKRYLSQRETDEKRRRRERQNRTWPDGLSGCWPRWKPTERPTGSPRSDFRSRHHAGRRRWRRRISARATARWRSSPALILPSTEAVRLWCSV